MIGRFGDQISHFVWIKIPQRCISIIFYVFRIMATSTKCMTRTVIFGKYIVEPFRGLV